MNLDALLYSSFKKPKQPPLDSLSLYSYCVICCLCWGRQENQYYCVFKNKVTVSELVHNTLKQWPIYWFQGAKVFSCSSVERTVSSPQLRFQNCRFLLPPEHPVSDCLFCQVDSLGKSRGRVSWLYFHSIIVWCYVCW